MSILSLLVYLAKICSQKNKINHSIYIKPSVTRFFSITKYKIKCTSTKIHQELISSCKVSPNPIPSTNLLTNNSDSVKNRKLFNFFVRRIGVK